MSAYEIGKQEAGSEVEWRRLDCRFAFFALEAAYDAGVDTNDHWREMQAAFNWFGWGPAMAAVTTMVDRETRMARIEWLRGQLFETSRHETKARMEWAELGDE